MSKILAKLCEMKTNLPEESQNISWKTFSFNDLIYYPFIPDKTIMEMFQYK